MDMTSEKAARDFRFRHEEATDGNHLDVSSYAFDAGSTAHLPRAFTLANGTTHPSDYTRAYARTIARVAPVADLVTMRVACGTQSLGRLVRLADKASEWGVDNGLQSMVAAAISVSLLGYPFIVTDAIGGSSSDGRLPSPELYVRWVQASVFMPTMQFR